MRTIEEFKQIISVPQDPVFIETHPYNGFNYFSTDHMIEMLNEAFDYCWSFSSEIILQKESVDKKGSPIHHIVSKGRLTGMFLNATGGIIEVSKEQFGSGIVNGSMWDMGVKGASSDALKKCASSFGIGLQVYPKSSWNVWCKKTVDNMNKVFDKLGIVDSAKKKEYLATNGIQPYHVAGLMKENGIE